MRGVQHDIIMDPRRAAYRKGVTCRVPVSEIRIDHHPATRGPRHLDRPARAAPGEALRTSFGLPSFNSHISQPILALPAPRSH